MSLLLLFPSAPDDVSSSVIGGFVVGAPQSRPFTLLPLPLFIAGRLGGVHGTLRGSTAIRGYVQGEVAHTPRGKSVAGITLLGVALGMVRQPVLVGAGALKNVAQVRGQLTTRGYLEWRWQDDELVLALLELGES